MINKSHALLFFTFTQQLWSRPAFRSEFTASRETETGKPKTWHFHNLVQFIVIHWVKFWLCQCHYLISCSLPNTRSCQPARVLAAKTISCPLCKDEHFWSTCAFITFHQTSGVFLFVFPIHKIFQHFLMALLFLSTLCTSPTGCCLKEKKKWEGGINQSMVWFPNPLAPGHPVSWETRLGIESFCFEETKQNCVLSQFGQSELLRTNYII